MADFPGTVGDDVINGTAGADTISDGGSAGNTAGNDTLNGGDGDDVITSHGGADTVDGGAGTDRLIIDLRGSPGGTNSTVNVNGGTISRSGETITYIGIENITFFGNGSLTGITLNAGNHIVVGGASTDSFSPIAGSSSWDGAGGTGDNINYQRATSGITVNADAGTVVGAAINDTIANIESIFATGFDDVMFGGVGTRVLGAGNGNDVLDTGTSTQAITLQGALGNDIYVVRAAAASVSIQETSGVDRVETDIGTYILPDPIENLEYFGAGGFNGTGNALNNIIVGAGLGDTLSGLDGNDTLGGEGGDDSLSGGIGNDRLNGGTGADTLDGGDGNDILVVDNAGDVTNGGAGTDTVELAAAVTVTIGADVEIVRNFSAANGANTTMNALDNTYGGSFMSETVFGGAGNDLIYGRTGNDGLNGELGNDRLFGDGGSDVLNGGDGNDLLYAGADDDTILGGAGNDSLYGENGNDNLIGGAGVDLLNGGAGGDSYIFATGDSGATFATADRIQGFSSAQGDKIDLVSIGASNFIGSAAFSNSAGEFRAQLINGNTYVQADLDGDGAADFMIRVDGNVPLSVNDFIFGAG